MLLTTKYNYWHPLNAIYVISSLRFFGQAEIGVWVQAQGRFCRGLGPRFSMYCLKFFFGAIPPEFWGYYPGKIL